MSQRIKITLYVALVRSMLLYGCEAWSILAKCRKRKIQIFQNKCLKIILQAPRYTRISELENVVIVPYIDELLEDRVYKMCQTISTHDNPVVRSMAHLYQWRAKYRNLLQELCNSEEALIRQIE